MFLPNFSIEAGESFYQWKKERAIRLGIDFYPPDPPLDETPEKWRPFLQEVYQSPEVYRDDKWVFRAGNMALRLFPGYAYMIRAESDKPGRWFLESGCDNYEIEVDANDFAAFLKNHSIVLSNFKSDAVCDGGMN